jgi:arginyl-tRNA synthetase
MAMIEDALAELLRSALASSGLDLDGEPPEIVLTKPKQKEHGDFATNLALQVAGRVGRPPLEVAEIIVANLPTSDVIESKQIARPGFINFRVRDDWLHRALRDVAAQGAAYGRSEPSGRRVQVEFVSANPTGPLHVGQARNAALGDALARLLEFTGWDVTREYYFNDAGGQMDRFGESVVARYLQAVGREAEVPDDGYHGAYLADIAEDILRADGPSLADLPPDERMVRLRDEAVRRVLPQVRSTLDRFGLRFDVYTSERTLAERGEIEMAVQRLRRAGLAYDAEGAVWFRSTDFGDDKDRPLIRSNGRHTYFAADCAYVIDKFSRGFDHVVYVWGADHHGDVARVRGAAQALGYDPSSLEFVIYQWVAFLRDGEPVPMSRRAGTFVTLDELIDEVGTDAARFHLLMFSPDATMNFDIGAVKRQSLDNPVYYVQYGHARIASILRKAAERGVELRTIDGADLTRLSHEAELDLLRAVADVAREIRTAAERRGPHRLTHAAQGLAARFHRFYTECPVLSDDAELTQARLWLCVGTKQVIANLLDLLGVSAPESMERTEDVERAQ